MAISMDSIIKLPTPQKVALLIFVLFAIFGIYWLRFYGPEKREIEAKRQDLIKLKKEMKRKEILAKNYDKFKVELDGVRERLKEAMEKLPEAKEIPLLLKSVANTGKEAGLEITLFKPKGEEVREFYARVPFEIRFLGRYHQVGYFFYKIAILPRIVTIENFTLERAQEGGNLLQASCNATTYRFLPAASKRGGGKKR